MGHLFCHTFGINSFKEKNHIFINKIYLEVDAVIFEVSSKHTFGETHYELSFREKEFLWRVVCIDATSSYGRCFVKKGVLKNFAELTGKHLCQSLFLNKVEGGCFLIKLQAEACNFIKKETLAQGFSCDFCEIFQNTFFTEHLQTIDFTYRVGCCCFQEINN